MPPTSRASSRRWRPAGHAVGSHDSGALATPAGPRQPPRRPDRCTPLAQASVPVRSR
jgi:hypothetical protein